MGRPSTRFWILFRYSGSLYKFFHLAIFLLPLESVNFFQFKTETKSIFQCDDRCCHGVPVERMGLYVYQ